MKVKELKPAYLLAGSEVFLIKENLEKLKDIFKAEIEDSFEINYSRFVVGEDNFEEFISAVNTLPFLTEKRLIILEGLENLTSAQKDDLLNYLEDPNPSCTLVGIIGKIKQNKKLYKAFESSGKVIMVDALRTSQLPGWVKKEFAKRGKKISYGSINYILENAGEDLQNLHNEIEKICLYHLGKKNLEIDDIKGLIVVSAESSVFELVDSLGKRRKEQAFFLLEKLLNENHDFLRIFFLIVRQFRLLLKAKILQERDYLPSDIYRELKLPPFIGEKYIKQSRNFSLFQLENAHLYLFEADYFLKTGRGESRFILENLLLKLLSEES